MRKTKFKNQNGITLIALVITIVVLLILAGVALSLVVGENGITERAVKASKIQNIAGAKEKLELQVADYAGEFYQAKYITGSSEASGTVGDYVLGKFTNNSDFEGDYTLTKKDNKITITNKKDASQSATATIDENGKVTWEKISTGIEEDENQEDEDISIEFAITGTKLNTTNLSSLSNISALPKVTAGTKATAKSRYTDSDNNIAVIPEGFTVSTVSGEQNVKTGLVIKDDDGNEFVWIPVDIDQSLSLKVTSKKTITDITLVDPKGDEISVGSYSGTEYPKTNLTPTLNGEYEVQVTTAGGTETEKLVVRSLYAMDSFNDWYNTDEAKLLSWNEASNRTEFASAMLGTESENYSSNVNSNGGFYIGRYEAGNDSGTLVSKPSVAVYNNVTRDQAKTLADGKYSGVSHLLTDSAWDRTLDFLINTNNKTLAKVAGDSKEWGNYSNSTISGTGSLTNTAAFGKNTRANNIYDLAGNVAEWTSTIGPDSGFPFFDRRRCLLHS